MRRVWDISLQVFPINQNLKPCVLLRTLCPYALPLQLTPPGTLTAHEKFCLVLLCSQPDTVHRHPLRKTQTSSPLIEGSHKGAGPRPDITPAIADCRYRGPLLPRLHGLLSIPVLKQICQSQNGKSFYRSQRSVLSERIRPLFHTPFKIDHLMVIFLIHQRAGD